MLREADYVTLKARTNGNTIPEYCILLLSFRYIFLSSRGPTLKIRLYFSCLFNCVFLSYRLLCLTWSGISLNAFPFFYGHLVDPLRNFSLACLSPSFSLGFSCRCQVVYLLYSHDVSRNFDCPFLTILSKVRCSLYVYMCVCGRGRV